MSIALYDADGEVLGYYNDDGTPYEDPEELEERIFWTDQWGTPHLVEVCRWCGHGIRRIGSTAASGAWAHVGDASLMNCTTVTGRTKITGATPAVWR